MSSPVTEFREIGPSRSRYQNVQLARTDRRREGAAWPEEIVRFAIRRAGNCRVSDFLSITAYSRGRQTAMY